MDEENKLEMHTFHLKIRKPLFLDFKAWASKNDVPAGLLINYLIHNFMEGIHNDKSESY